MTAYMLLFLMTFINSSSTALMKKFQVSARSETENYLQANICAGVASCVFLFIMNGCRISSISQTALVYSIAFGFLSTISIFLTAYVYSKTSMTLALIVGSAGGIVIPVVFGICFNGEDPSIRVLVSAVLILVAAILPFIKKGTFKGGIKFLWVLILFFLFSGATGIVSKLYAQSNSGVDTATYLILVNVFVILFSGLCGLGFLIKKKKDFVWINLKDATNTALRTILSVAGMYISVTILVTMPISVYSVLASALSLMLNALSSRFLFKEKLTTSAKISFVLALASIIVAG